MSRTKRVENVSLDSTPAGLVCALKDNPFYQLGILASARPKDIERAVHGHVMITLSGIGREALTLEEAKKAAARIPRSPYAFFWIRHKTDLFDSDDWLFQSVPAKVGDPDAMVIASLSLLARDSIFDLPKDWTLLFCLLSDYEILPDRTLSGYLAGRCGWEGASEHEMTQAFRKFLFEPVRAQILASPATGIANALICLLAAEKVTGRKILKIRDAMTQAIMTLGQEETRAFAAREKIPAALSFERRILPSCTRMKQALTPDDPLWRTLESSIVRPAEEALQDLEGPLRDEILTGLHPGLEHLPMEDLIERTKSLIQAGKSVEREALALYRRAKSAGDLPVFSRRLLHTFGPKGREALLSALYQSDPLEYETLIKTPDPVISADNAYALVELSSFHVDAEGRGLGTLLVVNRNTAPAELWLYRISVQDGTEQQVFTGPAIAPGTLCVVRVRTQPGAFPGVERYEQMLRLELYDSEPFFGEKPLLLKTGAVHLHSDRGAAFQAKVEKEEKEPSGTSPATCLRDRKAGALKLKFRKRGADAPCRQELMQAGFAKTFGGSWVYKGGTKEENDRALALAKSLTCDAVMN